jgi:hypothetical protein
VNTTSKTVFSSSSSNRLNYFLKSELSCVHSTNKHSKLTTAAAVAINQLRLPISILDNNRFARDTTRKQNGTMLAPYGLYLFVRITMLIP